MLFASAFVAVVPTAAAVYCAGAYTGNACDGYYRDDNGMVCVGTYNIATGRCNL